jgi:hypothetical protein
MRPSPNKDSAAKLSTPASGKDGAHFRNDGALEAMAEAIDRLQGPEYETPGRERDLRTRNW